MHPRRRDFAVNAEIAAKIIDADTDTEIKAAINAAIDVEIGAEINADSTFLRTWLPNKSIVLKQLVLYVYNIIITYSVYALYFNVLYIICVLCLYKYQYMYVHVLISMRAFHKYAHLRT